MEAASLRRGARDGMLSAVRSLFKRDYVSGYSYYKPSGRWQSLITILSRNAWRLSALIVGCRKWVAPISGIANVPVPIETKWDQLQMWSFVILNKQFVQPIASFQEPATKIGQYAGIQDRGRLKGLGSIEETKAYEKFGFRAPTLPTRTSAGRCQPRWPHRRAHPERSERLGGHPHRARCRSINIR